MTWRLQEPGELPAPSKEVTGPSCPELQPFQTGSCPSATRPGRQLSAVLTVHPSSSELLPVSIALCPEQGAASKLAEWMNGSQCYRKMFIHLSVFVTPQATVGGTFPSHVINGEFLLNARELHPFLSTLCWYVTVLRPGASHHLFRMSLLCTLISYCSTWHAGGSQYTDAGQTNQ